MGYMLGIVKYVFLAVLALFMVYMIGLLRKSVE